MGICQISSWPSIRHLRQAGVLQGARGSPGPQLCKAAIKQGRPECFWARPCLRGVSRIWGLGEGTVAVALARGHMLLEAGRWGRKWLGPGICWGIKCLNENWRGLGRPGSCR